MAKTRSQTGEFGIKKEKQEDCKPILALHSVRITPRNWNRITKRKPSKNKSTLPAQQFKIEEDADIKSLLQSPPKSSKLPKGQQFSQEQINQPIDYVVNHGMSINKASIKVKMSSRSGYKYYKEYNDDPEKKIPSPKTQCMQHITPYTQKQIGDLIRYIDSDKMPIKEASAKADINYASGCKYYSKYLKDPNHKIPTPRLCQYYTQDEKNEFIGYIVNDKMNIAAASRRAKMSTRSGRRYYHKYFNDQNPAPSHITIPKRYTQEQINKLISYIIDDKMPIAAASIKVKMEQGMARIYYRQHLKDNNMKSHATSYCRRYTHDQINKLIGYILDDKMTVKAASKKANMNYSSGKVHYRKYRVNHNLDMSDSKCTTQDKVNELIGYIVSDKMTIMAASKKANLHYHSGKRYYLKYLNGKKRGAWRLRVGSAPKNE